MTFSELSVGSTFSLLTQTFDPAYIPSNTSEYPPKANGLAPMSSRRADEMCDGGRRILDVQIPCSSLRVSLKAAPVGSRSPRAYSRLSGRKPELRGRGRVQCPDVQFFPLGRRLGNPGYVRQIPLPRRQNEVCQGTRSTIRSTGESFGGNRAWVGPLVGSGGTRVITMKAMW